MSILSVDNISPIGSGTSVTVNSAATLVLNNANSTGIITATTFVGALTGTASGNSTLANGSDNRVITATGANALTGESALTFDGNTLTVSAPSNDTPLIVDTASVNGAHLRFQKDGSNQHFVGAGGGFALGDREDLSLRAYDNLLFATGNSSTERLRIGSAGQLGIGGAHYGTSGQVLTSQGSGSTVQWATPAVTGGNMFIAKMNSGYITSNNTDGEIVFQNEVYDPDSRYNNSNGRFTPNVAGYYFIDASLQFSTNSANNNFESTIWKNGTEQFKNTMRNPASNSDIHCKVTGIVSVNGSSDYISIAAWQNSGGNITINPGNGSYFMGYFLRSL